MAKSSGKKGNRKHGRNKKFCEQYARVDRRGKNKAKRLRRHLQTHPTDVSAQASLTTLGR